MEITPRLVFNKIESRNIDEHIKEAVELEKLFPSLYEIYLKIMRGFNDETKTLFMETIKIQVLCE